MIFLKLIYLLTPMNCLLLMVILRMSTIFHTALPVLCTYCIHDGLHHFLLLLFIDLFLILFIIFIVISLQRYIYLLFLSLFNDILYIPFLLLVILICLFYDIALLRVLLPVLFYYLLQFDSISNGYIFPFVNLFLSEMGQMFDSRHSFFFKLYENSFHFCLNHHLFELFICGLLIIGCTHVLGVIVFVGLITAHRLHGLVHFFLLFLHFYLLAQRFQLIFLCGILSTNFYDSPSRILWLCGRYSNFFPFILSNLIQRFIYLSSINYHSEVVKEKPLKHFNAYSQAQGVWNETWQLSIYFIWIFRCFIGSQILEQPGSPVNFISSLFDEGIMLRFIAYSLCYLLVIIDGFLSYLSSL